MKFIIPSVVLEVTYPNFLQSHPLSINAWSSEFYAPNLTSFLGHHHHHISFMELGHLLTRSGLMYPEDSLKVYHNSFASWGVVFHYLLTPWCRVLLEKLIGLQLVKKFPAFHGTGRFITTLTSVRHLSLSWASPIQSTYIPLPGDQS